MDELDIDELSTFISSLKRRKAPGTNGILVLQDMRNVNCPLYKSKVTGVTGISTGISPC